MNEPNNRPERGEAERPLGLAKRLEEKGFYIILFLCVAAIGIAGYVFFFADPTDSAPVSAREDDAADILAAWTSAAAAATLPQQDAAVFGTTSATTKRTTTAAATTSAIHTTAAAPTVSTTASTTAPATTAAATAASAAAQAEEPAAPAAATTAPAADFFVRPLPGEVLAAYSGDELVYDRTNGDWRTHNGVDFAASDGDKVCAVADGRVADVYTDEYYGTSLLLDHGGGLQTVYTGLGEALNVKAGQEVCAGDVLGMLEASILFESALPVHLHLEMLQDGERIDPMSLIPG